MIIRSKAPDRIDLAGGWTDVPPYSKETGGFVVNAAISRYTYSTLVKRDDEKIRIISADFDTSVEIKNFKEMEYDGNLDMIKAAIKRLRLDSMGMDIFVRCDAPPGSGLGTSASVGVCLIGLLNFLQEEKLTVHEVARLANLVETEELNIAGGKQDQYASASGNINFMEFLDPSVSVSRLNLNSATINELEKGLILCYTGESRLSGNLISKVMGSYKKEEKRVVDALNSLRDIAVGMKSTLIKGDLNKFGELLSENWHNQKELDPSITNDNINRLFDIALKNGAIGGKALGAGGGGCLLFFCESDREHVVADKLSGAGGEIISFGFDFNGLQTWVIDRDDR